MSKEPLTHSDRYVRKTNRVILIIGIITLCVFLFCLMLIGSDDNEGEQKFEFDKSISAETDFGSSNSGLGDNEIVFSDVEEQERPITLEPNPVNMGQIVIGNEAANVLTIGTNSKKAIKILSVDLEDAPAEGFTFESDCAGTELHGDQTCKVTMKWLPTYVNNAQNNFKIIWHETNVSAANAKHDEVPVYGSAVTKDECNYCEGGTSTSVSSSGGKRTRQAIAPDGSILGVIDEDGIVRDAAGNIIGRVDANGLIIDENGNVIGVASSGQLIMDENGNVIGYVDENGIAYDNDGNVIGRVLEDGTVVDMNGNVIGKAAAYGYVYDDDGNIIGRVLADGSVIDANGKVIGRMNANGEVVDFDGNVIGHIAKSGKIATDENGKKLGIVMPDGSVIDEKGDRIGRIDADGNISTKQVIGKKGRAARMALDESGNVIGYLDDNNNVVDFDGKVVGKMQDDGSIVNDEGQVVGKISDEWHDLAVDENGNVIGYSDKDNIIRNNKGEVIGYFDENGSVIGNLDPEEAPIIGEVGSRVTLALDKDGNVIGYIDEDGNVIDFNGNIIGKVNSKGETVDADGNVIGYQGSVANLALDKSGEVIGYVNSNGVVYNKNGEIIAIADIKGNVRNFGQKVIGGVLNTDLLPVTPSGKILGKINNKGEVIDNKKVVGHIRPDRLVTDVTGGKIIAKGISAGYVVNWPCDFSTRLDKDGVIRRFDKETDYKVFADGTVWSSEDEFIGKIIKTGEVYDDTCEYIGRLSSDGYVRDNSGRAVGCVNPDDMVLALDEETPRIIGHVVRPMSVVSIQDWQNIGTIEENGVLLGDNGRAIGCMNGNGDVFDHDRAIIGIAQQPYYAFDIKGKPLGKVGKGGRVKMSGISDAHVGADGLIMDKNLRIVGYTMPEISIFVDAEGKKIGHLFADGVVYNSDGVALDKINGGRTGLYGGKAAALLLPEYVVDMNGNRLGRVNYDSVVTDFNGQRLASINAAGNVFAEDGILLGSTVRRGAARGYDGMFLGYVAADGSVVELADVSGSDGRKYKRGEVTGHVTSDGYVFRDKKIVGEVLPQNIMVDVFAEPVGFSNGYGNISGFDGKITALLPGGGNNQNYTEIHTGIVIDFSGNAIGTALANGQFADSRHVISGRVLADGKVISNEGNFLGEVISGDIVIGNDDRFKGIVGIDGIIRNDGAVMGHILTDGLAVDKQNNIIGRVYTIGSIILSEDGNYIGRLAANGKVISPENKEIGFIKSNGSFVDMDKNVSGYVLPEVARNRRN